MIFSSANIKKDFESINEAFSQLQDSYMNSAWYDCVKESFSFYVDICKKYTNNLDDCNNKANNICHNLNSLSIDAKLLKSKELNIKTKELIDKAR